MDGERLIGATINSPLATRHSSLRPDALLFGESAGRIVVSCEPHHVERLARLTRQHGVPAAVIGRVGGARLSINAWIDVSVDDVNRAWRTGLKTALETG